MTRHNIQFSNDELWERAKAYAKAHKCSVAQLAQHGMRLAMAGVEMPPEHDLSDDEAIAEYELLRRLKRSGVAPSQRQRDWLAKHFEGATWEELLVI